MSADKFMTRKKTTIQTILMGNYQKILGKCHEKELVTPEDYMNLKGIHKGTVGDHVIELVDKIMGKGEETCQEFLNLLKTDQDIKDTFPALKKVMVNFTVSLPKPEEELTSTAKTRDVVQKTRKRKHKKDSSDDVTSKNKKSKKGPYPLKSKPPGMCFIINNKNFKDQNRRDGSDVDAESLAKVFSWLQFRVLMCEDKTKDQMERVLKCLSSATDVSNLSKFKVKEWSDGKFTDLQEDPAHGDAFICCILTHGNMGVVCGTDGKRLPIKDMKKTFKASKESPLTNKPKVFLIQACQGGEVHGRVVSKRLQSDQLASIPEECDILVGIATVEDYESYRHPALGSWYIQAVCKQLWEDCPSGVDMVKILTNVNDEVSQKDGRMEERPGVILKQMPEIRSSLTRDLVFSPPPN